MAEGPGSGPGPSGGGATEVGKGSQSPRKVVAWAIDSINDNDNLDNANASLDNDSVSDGTEGVSLRSRCVSADSVLDRDGNRLRVLAMGQNGSSRTGPSSHSSPSGKTTNGRSIKNVKELVEKFEKVGG